MMINEFQPFIGQHCETTATGCLLKHMGLYLSEPLLFGVGQGLGFIYWDMKSMDFPFIGGRIKPDMITDNLAKNLGLNLEVKETSSVKIAWRNVKEQIDSGKPVGLKLDSYYLDYFTSKIHFAGHYVAMYGYDDSYAYLVDTKQQGSMVKVTLENVEQARNAKGPMSSRNKSYVITGGKPEPDLKKVIRCAIKANAIDFLNPPIKNIGCKGIEKASVEVKKWLSRSNDQKNDVALAGFLMERAGTGGALFRNLYRDFLQESLGILGSENGNLDEGYKMFAEIASLWTEVSALIIKAGETQEQIYLDEASGIMADLAKREKAAMGILAAS